MDPISALIGGGMSLLGGIFGSEATSAANQANIQQAQWQATGAYLPGLVRNAQAAGINPLAVIPGGGGSANIQPVNQVGSALGDIGQNLSRMKMMSTPADPHAEEMNKLNERKARADAEGAEIANALGRAQVANLTGTPRLGHANEKLKGPATTWVENVVGEKPGFPFSTLSQAADIGIGGVRSAAGALGPWLEKYGIPLGY